MKYYYYTPGRPEVRDVPRPSTGSPRESVALPTHLRGRKPPPCDVAVPHYHSSGICPNETPPKTGGAE